MASSTKERERYLKIAAAEKSIRDRMRVQRKEIDRAETREAKRRALQIGKLALEYGLGDWPDAQLINAFQAIKEGMLGDLVSAPTFMIE